jgi:LysM repeat protein
MKTVRFLGLLVILGLLLVPALPAVAQQAGDDDVNTDQAGGNQKILVIGLHPGWVVQTIIEGTVAPNGAQGASLIANEKGSVETFAPLGFTTQVFLEHPQLGRISLGEVTPVSAEGDVVLDANQEVQFAQSEQGFMSQGLASPTTDEGQSMEQTDGSDVGTVGGDTYIIKPGDTLSEIARDYGISLEDLAAANDISDPNRIFFDRELIIPDGGRSQVADQSGSQVLDEQDMGDGQSTMSGASISGSTYVIQPGDSLWSLSQRLGVSSEELARANNISNPDLIFSGESLTIPGGVQGFDDQGLASPMEDQNIEQDSQSNLGACFIVPGSRLASLSGVGDSGAGVNQGVMAAQDQGGIGFVQRGLASPASDYLLCPLPMNMSQMGTSTQFESQSESEQFQSDELDEPVDQIEDFGEDDVTIDDMGTDEDMPLDQGADVESDIE